MPYCNFNTPQGYADAIKDLPKPSQEARKEAQARQQQLTKPPGSLGMLEEIAVFLCGWQEVDKPQLRSPLCLIFAGNHGIAAKGVSAYPAEVTAQMVANFEAGGAAINQLCRWAEIDLKIHPIDLDNPTADFTSTPAMTIKETLTAMQIGAEAITDSADIILLGEMGIGNSSSASALALTVLGGEAKDWVGYGTGLDDEGLKRKIEAVNLAFEMHKDSLTDGLNILACLGGRELAAIAGACLEARHRRLPVLVDGFIATAALLPLFKDNSDALSHCLISHRSAEKGHARMLEKLDKHPILDLSLRLGEGSGAALALPILQAATEIHNRMATFNEANVSTSGGPNQ